MDICQQQGWNIHNDWMNLPEWERVDWLARHHRKRKQAETMLKALQYEETDEKGTRHLVRDYATFIALLRETSP